MSFELSEQFNQRWKNSPDTIKSIIHQELEDIKVLLNEDTKMADFVFANANFDQQLSHLQSVHLHTQKQIQKQATTQKLQALIPSIEKQIDDKLAEQMGTLSDDMRQYIRQVVKEALDKL